MARTLKVLSALLNYPTAELVQAAPELRDVVAGEGIVAGEARHALDLLLDEIAAGDLYDLQERYVLLFDRTRSLSLHLFEHLHGESRDRGEAMIDLMAHYGKHGYEIEARELPDYLPLFLEFLSTQPEAEARALLAQPISIIAALTERLKKRRSPYATLFVALEALANKRADRGIVGELMNAPDHDADDLAALDAAWEEAPVTFGPGTNPADACGTDRLATRLRAAARPADTNTPARRGPDV